MASFFASLESSPSWEFEATSLVSPSTASTISPITASLAPPSDNSSLITVEEQFIKSLAAGIVVAAIRQIACRLKDLSTILNGDTKIIRVYLPFDALPLDWLDSLLQYFSRQNNNPIHEIHICIRSLLRPCLQDIYDESYPASGIASMFLNWTSSGTSLLFYFYRLGADITPGRDRFPTFHEKDLMRAIEGLSEHDEVLTEILGDESCLYNASMTSDDSEVLETPLVDEFL